VQETAKLEAQAFELEQKTAIAHEAKTVLDSWVRYEGQVKQRQQRELAESIIAKIEKELENPKTLKQILDQSVADVESASHTICHGTMMLTLTRDRRSKGISALQYSSVTFNQCYINLCNSQARQIESTHGLGKGRIDLILFSNLSSLPMHSLNLDPIYSLDPSPLSNNPSIVSAHMCAASRLIAFSS
jgi:hypothetical protein